ncbi:S8 family serine peptidase [Neobacillus sp. NPDC097160]|uniref:S8 family serine peptidase n=1 Tax=Neobacillus sp. NPDC097160 TaxID=3364298 RepID=UPI0038196C05
MRRFPRILSALFMVCIPLMVNVTSVTAVEADQQPVITETVTDQVNVLVDSNFSSNSLNDYEMIKEMNLGNQKLYTLKVTNPQLSMAEIKKIPGVLYVEQDHSIKQEYIPKDPGFSKQWFHQTINTPSAWDQTKGSSSVTVAVIDGSVDTSHPDLKDRIVAPYDMARHMSSLNYPDEHGTHVAGIIAAGIDNGIGGAGVAPQVNIMPINVFIGDYGDTSDLIAGIDYAINHHAQIINMSLGDYQYSYLLDRAVQNAYRNGIIIVAAAGNEGVRNPSYPAAYDNVISVSSVSANNHFSDFSNYGSTIDIAAPGDNIYSTIPGGTFDYMSGTSMASPVVAGVAALVLSQNPDLTAKQVVDSLLYSADDLGPAGRDDDYGYGLVNAKKAINYITPVKGEWKLNGSTWYYYENGIMKTGWVKSSRKWYYLNNRGAMQTGWVLYSGTWYFLGESGDMKTGWLSWHNAWYYLDADGKMATGWITSNGKWYYLDADGKMATGWVFLNGNWYYLSNNGDMKTGWILWANKWYYLKDDGSMAQNTSIQGYRLGIDGVWIP